MRAYMSVMVVPALVGIFTLGGCYDNIEPAAEADSQPTQSPPTAGTPSYGTAGQPALGGARKAAEGITSDAQQKSQEIADGIENY